MSAKIASIHFHPLKADRGVYGGYYSIDAVPVGGDPIVIMIEDKIQYWQGPYAMSGVEGRRSQHSTRIAAEDIAADIVREWTENGVGKSQDSHPGVWVVREKRPVLNPDGTWVMGLDKHAVFEPATFEECQQMFKEDLAKARACDANYASYLIQDANAIASDPRGNRIPFIQPVARAAAKAYRPDVMWLREGAALQMKICPYCTKPVAESAIKCPSCSEIIDFEAYGRMEARKNESVRKAKEDLTKERNAAERAAAQQVA